MGVAWVVENLDHLLHARNRWLRWKWSFTVADSIFNAFKQCFLAVVLPVAVEIRGDGNDVEHVVHTRTLGHWNVVLSHGMVTGLKHIRRKGHHQRFEGSCITHWQIKRLRFRLKGIQTVHSIFAFGTMSTVVETVDCFRLDAKALVIWEAFNSLCAVGIVEASLAYFAPIAVRAVFAEAAWDAPAALLEALGRFARGALGVEALDEREAVVELRARGALAALAQALERLGLHALGHVLHRLQARHVVNALLALPASVAPGKVMVLRTMRALAALLVAVKRKRMEAVKGKLFFRKVFRPVVVAITPKNDVPLVNSAGVWRVNSKNRVPHDHKLFLDVNRIRNSESR